MKKLLYLFIALVFSLTTVMTYSSSFAYSDGADPKVFLNGDELVFYNKPYTQNTEMMVSAKEFFGYLQAFVEYTEQNVLLKGYLATVNGIEVLIPRDSNIVYYDEVPLEFGAKTAEKDNDIFFPIRCVSYFYGAEYKQEENKAYINFEIDESIKVETEAERQARINQILTAAPEPVILLDESSLENSAITANMKKNTSASDETGKFEKVYEFENFILPEKAYDIQFTAPSLNAIEAGDVIVWKFWARKISTTDESGFAYFIPCFERVGGDWKKILSKEKTAVSEEWTEFTYTAICKDHYDVGGTHMAMRVGFKPQKIQFAGMRMLNYKKTVNPEEIVSGYSEEKITSYKGREEDALWRQEAFKRIEKHRVRDMKFMAVDESGVPLEGVDINARMTRSEFLWGTAVSDYLIGLNDSDKFYDILKEYFNAIVMESSMKESVYNNGFGKRSGTRHSSHWINYAKDNNMYFRMHAINWDNASNTPIKFNEWKSLPIEEYEKRAREHYQQRVSEMLTAYGDTVTEVDVINEALNNSDLRSLFGKQFTVDIFKYCRVVRPDLRLVYNETGFAGLESQWSVVTNLVNLANELIELGAPIDAVGMQDHAGGFCYPQTVYNQFDAVANITGQACITEYDYIAGATAESPEVAAAIEADTLRDHIILAYSNPKIYGFMMWGFTDKGHWRSNGPLFDSQYNPKPTAVGYWQKYVMDEWKTDVSGKTDKEGVLSMRGHRGEYEITAKYNGKEYKCTLKVSENGENSVKLVLKDDILRLTPSEEVVKTEAVSPIAAEITENRSVYQGEYSRAIDRTIESIKNESGRDMSFLKSADNKAPWVGADKVSELVIMFDRVYDRGVLDIDWHKQGQINNFSIEVSEDGENFEPFTVGSGTDKTSINIDKRLRYIKIKPLGGSSASIKHIQFMREV